MRSKGEHVNRLNFPDVPVLFLQQSGVPGLGGGVAGNIDQPVRLRFGDGVDHGGIQAFAGWIHDDDVRPQALPDHPGKQVFGLSLMEGGVLSSIFCIVMVRLSRCFRFLRLV